RIRVSGVVIRCSNKPLVSWVGLQKHDGVVTVVRGRIVHRTDQRWLVSAIIAGGRNDGVNLDGKLIPHRRPLGIESLGWELPEGSGKNTVAPAALVTPIEWRIVSSVSGRTEINVVTGDDSSRRCSAGAHFVKSWPRDPRRRADNTVVVREDCRAR